jgi:hypothetical protein
MPVAAALSVRPSPRMEAAAAIAASVCAAEHCPHAAQSQKQRP